MYFSPLRSWMRSTRWVIHYLDLAYFTRFAAVFLGLHFFHIAFIGITEPGGSIHIPFLEEYLNYIAWLRNSLLQVSSLIVRVFGYNSFIEEPYAISTERASVVVGFTCIGYDLMSFWTAFVVAHKSRLLLKVKWVFVGCLAIWAINCCRLGILLIALHTNRPINGFLDHHNLFNIVAYCLILILIYLYNQKGKSSNTPNLFLKTNKA